jgi:hypothetical protein
MGMLTSLATWLSGRATGQELADLASEELGALARDVGLSADQLMQLSAHGTTGSQDLPLLMVALGLVPEKTARIHPGVMRDMSVVCSGCKLKRRCRSDISNGWAPVVQRYCPNAHAIRSLHRERYELVLPPCPVAR